MDQHRERNLVADHLVDAFFMCEPSVTDLELADFILQHFARVPLEDAGARKVALDMLTDAVRSKRTEVQERFRLLEQRQSVQLATGPERSEQASTSY